MDIEKELINNGIEDARFVAKQIKTLPESEWQSATARVISGEPLQYVLGIWEFYGLPFYVGKGVLIPRPDTETLVDEALKFANNTTNVLDLCSGSGAIAIAVEKLSGAKVTAVEKYPEALNYLSQNKKLNNSEIEIVEADIFSLLPNKKFDLILSNPPYIKSADLPFLQKQVQFEPTSALDGGKDGLTFYKGIIDFIPNLNPGGKIMVEVGYDIVNEVKDLFISAGLTVTSAKDLSGTERVIIGTLPL